MKRLTWGAGMALLGASLRRPAPPADKAPKPDNPPKADVNPPATVDDSEFVTKATGAFLAEINMGRLAAENSSNADVKQFGQRMVDDHTKGLDELDKAANKAGFTPAQAMDAKDRDLFTKLSSLKGADFDKAYVPSQVADHKEAIGLFEAESKNGKNDDLKAIAGKMVPMLQHHLELAQKLPDADVGTKPEKTSTDKDKPNKDK